MLPMWLSLSPKVLRLHVGPDGLRGAVWRGRHVLARASTGAPAADAPASAAIDGLLAALAEQTTLSGVRAEVELADALVTLDVVEGEFAEHGERQLQAIATACSVELLGANAATHELRWQLQCDERHLLICALPREVLSVLNQAFMPHGVVLRSAQPRLCGSWNRHRRHLGKGAAVLAVTDATSTTIACLQGGAIAALGRLAGDASGLIDALDAHVARLQASLGWDAQADSRYLLIADRIASPKALQRWTLLPSDVSAFSAFSAQGDTA